MAIRRNKISCFSWPLLDTIAGQVIMTYSQFDEEIEYDTTRRL